jgi:DNA-binding response OmpR family regulator
MAEPLQRVLIVEDDDDIASALSRGLAREGYHPLVAHDAASAMALAAGGCEAAIIDVMLGDDRGEDLVRRLRADGMTAPIIMLSALSGVDDRANGLAAGADDYVAKPFEFAELLARLKVQARRRAAAQPARRGLAGISYDPELREVSGNGRTVALTDREGDLFAFLVANAGCIVSRGKIFDALWLVEGGSSENVVDVYIGYLRRKLAPMSDFGIAIRTVRGRGFMLTENKDG